MISMVPHFFGRPCVPGITCHPESSKIHSSGKRLPLSLQRLLPPILALTPCFLAAFISYSILLRIPVFTPLIVPGKLVRSGLSSQASTSANHVKPPLAAVAVSPRAGDIILLHFLHPTALPTSLFRRHATLDSDPCLVFSLLISLRVSAPSESANLP